MWNGEELVEDGRIGFDDFGKEAFEVVAFEGGDARELNLEGVEETAIFREAEVEVRAGGTTSGTDLADDMFFAYLLPLFDEDAAEVSVVSDVAVRVFDGNEVAVSAFTSGESDESIGNDLHRCARWSAVVDAVVLFHFSEDGVKTFTESTRDARGRKRGLKKAALHAFAVSVVVVAFFASIGDIVEGIKDLVGGDVASGEHAAGAKEVAVKGETFVDDGEGVAGVSGAMEVDDVCEDFEEGGSDGSGGAGGFETLPEVGFYGTFEMNDGGFDGDFEFFTEV